MSKTIQARGKSYKKALMEAMNSYSDSCSFKVIEHMIDKDVRNQIASPPIINYTHYITVEVTDNG